MQEITEIRWHARGGQGAVTAAKMVAEVALSQNKYFQAFPEYGPERSGAPIVAFTRLSDGPIQIYSAIEHPDYVLVLDPTLLDVVDVTAGTGENAVVIVNSEEDAADVGTRPEMSGKRVYAVPATRIALETIKRAIPNTPLIGALVRVSGLFPLEGVMDEVRDSLSKKFPEEVVDANLEAVKRGYEEVSGI
ncbi:MAG: 2-oxoacid:acceptor oxidoreductase family protein [Thermoleophilia bacterium]|nr:2-oxoacid:acceptor oxidoreductase family protein [Thermoleophilia bacterium]